MKGNISVGIATEIDWLYGNNNVLLPMDTISAIFGNCCRTLATVRVEVCLYVCLQCLP